VPGAEPEPYGADNRRQYGLGDGGKAAATASRLTRPSPSLHLGSRPRQLLVQRDRPTGERGIVVGAHPRRGHQERHRRPGARPDQEDR
jgi:hypothetical protein